MKILFVISSLNKGGAERVLQILSNNFVKKHDVKIAILQDDSGYYKFDEKIEILKLNVYKSPLKFAKYRILRETFIKENPSVIISFIDWNNVACIISNFALGKKIIATEHNSYDLLPKKFSIIRNFAYKFVDYLTVLTKSDYKYYSKFVKNLEVMYNPFFSKTNNENFSKKNVILSVARLEKIKGYDRYFRALSLIDKEILKDYEILILGDGTQKENLQNLAKKLNLNIKFLGHQEDVAKFYEKAKIFVLSSYSEGLPNVLIEAMFYKCARLCSDTIGANELIENEVSGLIFKDEKELAKKLEKLMIDENLCEFLSKNAYEKRGDFMPEIILKKWENLIEKVVNK